MEDSRRHYEYLRKTLFLEGNSMSNFIETIREPEEIQALTMDLVKSAKEEILGSIFNFKCIPQTGSCWFSFFGRRSFEVARNTGKDSDSI